MIKKLALSLITMLMVASIGFASPLNDFSQGKTSVDITWRPAVNISDKWTAVAGPWAGDGGSDANNNAACWDWRITSGLGNGWAIQYNRYDAIADSIDSEVGVKTQELNALYKLDKNIAAFVGYHEAKFNYSSLSASISCPTKNTLQVGLIGTTEIANKTNVYGVVAFGKDLANYEAGISYGFAKDTEVNISYRYKKVKALSDTFNYPLYSDEYKDDVTTKGVGYGITYKF